uniref:Movement protein n=1 Tax=Panagrellus redivivus TaxID=6233 RepID=A0A7E4VTH4_PANRE
MNFKVILPRNGTAAANLVAMEANQGLFNDIGVRVVGAESVAMKKGGDSDASWLAIVLLAAVVLGCLAIALGVAREWFRASFTYVIRDSDLRSIPANAYEAYPLNHLPLIQRSPSHRGSIRYPPSFNLHATTGNI